MQVKNIYFVLVAMAGAACWTSAFANCGNGFNLRTLIVVPAGDAGRRAVDQHIRRLVLNTAKAFACQEFVNHYAESSGLPKDIVKSVASTTPETGSKLTFSNNSNENLCGLIRYRVAHAEDVPKLSKSEADARLQFSSVVLREFMQINIASEVEDWALRYTPDGRSFPRPTAEKFDAMIQQYQARVADSFQTVAKLNGWTPDDVERFTSAIECAPLLPEATGPDMQMLVHYPSAYNDFVNLVRDLDAQVK
jgi:hypothetical protein